MKSVRSGLGLSTLGDKVFAVGGYDEGGKDLKSVEVYDIEKDSWSAGPTLNTPRRFFGLITVNVDKKLCHKNLFQ